MIDRTHELPLVRQCQTLELARSPANYQPQPLSAEELNLMRRIDELYMDWLFAGVRTLSWILKREGQPVGRRCVSTLMKRTLTKHYHFDLPKATQDAKQCTSGRSGASIKQDRAIQA